MEASRPVNSRLLKWTIAVVIGVVSLLGVHYISTTSVSAQPGLSQYDAALDTEMAAKRKARTKAKKKKKKKTFHISRLSQNDIKLMANAVYGEARGEPYIGQVAIASVIINRSKSPNFPESPAAVIFEPRAFTAVADGQIYLTPNPKAKKAVRDAMRGWDPTGGCTYYFNPATATSKWIWGRPQVKRIGKHIFCR
nr:cell wall hydrolase [Brevibacillus dissolubilis]